MSAARPWHREPLAWLLFLIPGLSVVMGAVMIVLAVRSDDGLVADDYYRRGLEINRRLARDEAARRAALEATVTRLTATAVEVHLRRGAGEEPAGPAPERLTLDFRHATRAGRDRRIELARAGPGHYTGAGEWPAPGTWRVELGTAAWRLSGRLAGGATAVELGPR